MSQNFMFRPNFINDHFLRSLSFFIMFLHCLFTFVLTEVQHDALFLENDIEKANKLFQSIETFDSHIYQYFINKIFYNDTKKAACHLFSSQGSPFFDLIFSYNSYFSTIFTCDHKTVADLYIKPAGQIFNDYVQNKHEFKTKIQFKEVELQKDLNNTMEHVSNLITAGDSKAEELFLKLIQSGRVSPGKYENMLKYLAEKGNARAMGILGEMYYDGWGVDKCESTAMHYFTEGSNKKNASCLNGMGLIYKKNKDNKSAKRCFEEASKRGYPEADYNLFVFYKENYATEDIGLGYLLSSANNGYLPAIYTYAKRLYKSKNYRSAVLYLCAICDYSKEICEYLDKAENLYLEKKYDPCMMTLLFAAEMGSTHALYNILYLAKKIKSVSFYDKNKLIFMSNKRLADMGYKTNLVELGDCYFYGVGIDKSYSDAYAFYLSAALNNIAEGFYSLSYLYEHGLGVEKNLVKSINCLFEVKRNENKAYLLVWYVFVKLSIKLVLHFLFTKEIIAGFLTLIVTLSVFLYNKKNVKNIKEDKDNNKSAATGNNAE